MIPKKLHYCWFGGRPKPDLVRHCLRSWTETCPEYTIVEWNERNFAVDSSPMAAYAYNAGKFAFVSDVVRAQVLYEHGGIYVDSAVEIHRNLNRFLEHDAFTGFEMKGLSFTALWGSIPGHRLAKLVLGYYDHLDAKIFLTKPNTLFITDIMKNEFGVDPGRDELQFCEDGLVVYPSNFFCVDLPEHYATHHFAGSWLAQKHPRNWSRMVLTQFYVEALHRMSNSDNERLRWHASQILKLLAARARKGLTWTNRRRLLK
jgi:hypothetical protein